MSVPKVSVLVPTYNYARFLDKAIQSVLSQTFKDFELIVVDDNSTDNTDQVVQQYLSDPRVSYYKNSSNLGLPGNWNKCLSLAKGAYIKFLMADDEFHPALLEKFTIILDQHPNVSIVTSYKEHLDLNNNVIERYCQPFSHLQKGRRVIYESLTSFNFIGEPTTVMFRKSNLHLGVFNTKYNWLPDWDMWIRHLTIGDCYIIPEVLSYFRLHDEQATAHLSKSLRRQLEEYDFYKTLKIANPYKIDLSQIEIDKILKTKSYKYIRSSIKGLTKRRNGSWPTFKDALKKYVTERFANSSVYEAPAG